MGSALRTISLRLRGTSVEILEEMGEETDGAVESVSKMQAKLKALTGVDILTDSGAYKDTYTILKDIAEVWEDMDSMDQAAALELMAGKNRANTLAAILNNIEDLEGAYESALGAEGSAMRENEAYLDSIQGRIDLFNNALQTLWMNFLNADVIKFVVDLGTALLELVDSAGVLQTIFKTFGGIWLKKNVGASLFGDTKSIKDNLSLLKEAAKSAEVTWLNNPTAKNKKIFDEAKENLDAYEKQLKDIDEATDDMGNTTVSSGKKMSGAFDKTKAAAKGLATQLKQLAQSMAMMYAITAVFELIGDGISWVTDKIKNGSDSVESLNDKYQEASDKLSACQSELKGLESEFDTINEQINTLISQGTPTYADQQELERLQNISAELQRQIALKQVLEGNLQSGVNANTVNAGSAYLNASFDSAQSKTDRQDEAEESGKKWGKGAGLTLGAAIGVAIALGAAGFFTGGATWAGVPAALSTGIGTIGVSAGVGAMSGELVGGAIGAASEGAKYDKEQTVEDAINKMNETRDKLIKARDEAYEAYISSPTDTDKMEEYESAAQALSLYDGKMADHISQISQYYNTITSNWDNATDDQKEAARYYGDLLDKYTISMDSAGAKENALSRIFGENASEEIQSIKEQILDAAEAGQDFDFESAVNSSQKLKSTLDYVGLSAEDVKNYFTQIGEVSTAASSENINFVDAYSVLTESITKYNDILEQTAEILGDNTKVTQEYKDSIIELVGSKEEVNECFDENNSLVVKNAKKLKSLVAQNVKLKKSQQQLDYYNLVKQLNNTLNGTKQLDGATRSSIDTLLNQIDVVERAIYQYQLLEDSLLGANNAFSEFAKAQEIDALNTYGDSYVEMAQTMYDGLFKTGQVGTEQFWASVEALIPTNVYQHLTEDADRMKAIYDYYNKNVLPTLKLEEDSLSMDYDVVENFIKEGLNAGVFTGDIKNFDLVENLNLEEAAEKLGYTKTQAYALFAELDKYNVAGNELSFLSQLDDSFEGKITKLTNSMEELNRQKLALLADGGYEKNKDAIDAINKQLTQCEQSMDAASIEAYNMWQEYAKNDVALDALSAIEDKQKELTKEGAAALGIEWDDAKGKTIQQVYDELLAKQQQLGTPTELTVQFAKEHIDAALDDLEQKLKAKEINIEANVVWDKTDKQYEVAEGSEYANDADLQKYIDLQNEGYALDNYFENGMTVTEGYLSSIESILQSIYDLQSGKDIPESESGESDIAGDSVGVTQSPIVDNFINNSDSLLTAAQYEEIAAFFTDTIPEVAGEVSATLSKFFTETVPQEWNAFWEGVGVSLSEFGNDVEQFVNIINTFFTQTIPQEWNAFWEGVGEKLNEVGDNAEELYNIVSAFFTETIPAKWDKFWADVDKTVFADIPFAVGYVGGVVSKFFVKTIPEKWNEFWNDAVKFVEDAVNDVTELCNIVDKFITETIPEKWNEFWESVGDFYEESIEPVLRELQASVITFFNDTLPTKWNEFWDDVENFFTETLPGVVDNINEAISTFFTVTIPEKWNEFWSSVAQFIDENIVPALALVQSKLETFFGETLPTKWAEFWTSVGQFFTETIPAALQQIGSQITQFFTVTIPAKLTEFWTAVDAAFITPIATAIQTIGQGITTFFTVTVPDAINGMWSSLGAWIAEKASSIWSHLTAGFTAGFGGGDGGAGGGAGVNGTAHVRGTAYSKGKWGAPRTETALVGELGPEMLVRNGRWMTVGDNGAEFTQVKKGDIIFNHKQTEDLLSKGYVTGRGKLHGGAFASGTAYSGLWKPVSPDKSQSNKPGRDFSADGDKLYNSASALSAAAKALSSSSDEFKEVFDWIEVRLEEINEDISLISAKLENTIGFSKQNEVVDDMIKLNQQLYDNLTAGANKYYAFAAELLKKVPAEYRAAAQDGTIAIESFVGEVNEKTLEAINNYREWVQKGADATQQAEEVLTEISNLAKQAIDNIVSDFDNKTSLNDSVIAQLEAYNSLIETSDGFESGYIYEAIIKANNENINKLKEQRDAMQAELNAQVQAGNIEKYSQNWYDAVNAIAEVDTKIIELTADTNNYQDSINELHWDRFDVLMSQYEAIADETENLIDILGAKDLVDKDTAEWTNEGIATLGLYAQQMEVAEVQAKKYEEEIKYLNKNWQKLGYTETEYIEKLEELKSNQYDAIKAYNDTKDAIVDLNKERVDAIKKGIEKEIEAHEELINKKKEELDAEKDIHDFQKNVADQQKNIADIERRLAAISGDNSASARAQRAKLESELAEARAELEETYYDRSVQDQQNALDKELESFQEEKDKEMEALDEYLENTEQVVADSLNMVQANTSAVYQTLQGMSEEYGLSITESITSPWKDGEVAIQSYAEKFGISMSSTVDELQKVADKYKEIMAEIDGYGNEVVNKAEQNASNYQAATYVEPVKQQSTNTQQSSTSTNSGDIKVGDTIYAGDAPIYEDTTSEKPLKQYYSDDPYYTVVEDKGPYVLVRHESQKTGVTGYFKEKDVTTNVSTKYAKGTTGAKKDGLALIDELGEELRLVPDGSGRLAYVAKGTGIVPADLTANLMEWGKLDPSMMLDQNRPQIGVSPSVINNTTEIHIDSSVGELLHVEHLDGSNPAEVTKIVDKAWDKHMKELNAYVRRYTNR